MGIKQRVAHVEAVDGGVEENFLLQQYATYAVRPCGNLVPFETNDVLVPLRTIILALIFVQAQVELGVVLDNRFVER